MQRGPSASRRRAKRPVQCVGGKLGRVALERREATQLAIEGVDADPGRLEQRSPLDQRDRGAAGRDGAAAAAGVERGGSDPPATVEHDGDPHKVVAGGSPGGARESAIGQASATARALEVLAEGHFPSMATFSTLRHPGGPVS